MFSLMFVYLDYWSLIPISVMWLVNLVVFGVGRTTNKVGSSQPVLEYRPEVDYPMVRYRETMLRETDSTGQEESPDIFLNSITAIFFPTCHLHLAHISSEDQLGKVNNCVCSNKLKFPENRENYPLASKVLSSSGGGYQFDVHVDSPRAFLLGHNLLDLQLRIKHSGPVLVQHRAGPVLDLWSN